MDKQVQIIRHSSLVVRPIFRNAMQKSHYSVYVCAIVLVCLAFFAPASIDAQPPTSIRAFEPIDCPFNVPQGKTINCGYLTVPENRAQPNGRTIRIFVAIIKSPNPTPKPDPIIYLRGGIGSPTQTFIEDRLAQIEAWLATRDVILFDQRALGWSQPALNCPEIHHSTLQKKLGVPLTIEQQVEAGLICRDRWQAEGIDLAAYNSFETAADIADLWQALDYEQVNLIGASYWTIVAQLIMRDFGQEGRIRSVVLDSPVPLIEPAMANTPAQLSASMARLFEECAANVLCRTAYPNLDTVYVQIIEQLKTSPVTLPAVNPLNGQPFTFPFTVIDFGDAIQYGNYRDIPQLIYNIHDGNYATIIKARQNFIREFGYKNAGEHFGFRTTYNCNEPWNTISPEQKAAIAGYLEAAFFDTTFDDALCQQWPAFSIPRQTLATGTIPTLILTGEYDTRLPPAYGQMIADSLAQGFQFHVPNAPHAALMTGDPCPKLMALAFFDDPTQPPDSACLASTGTTFFDTKFVLRTAAMERPVLAAMGAMSLFLVGLVLVTATKIRKQQSFSFAWRHAARLIGWQSLIVSAGLVWLAFYAAQTRLLPVNPLNAIALTLPVIIAIQAAFLFSPEDEPALEVMLAAPRPAAWTLLERLAVLFVLQGTVGLLSSIYLAFATHTSVAVSISRWLPLVFLLSGVSVYLTQLTRRAIFGVLIVSLLWFVLTLFGDFMVERWPVAWPLHLYLQPSQPQYNLNRLFTGALGVTLIGLAALRLSRHPERLLLGHNRQKQQKRISADEPFATTGESPRKTFFTPPVYLMQMAAIIRYEFILQWRRITLPILATGFVITPVIGAFVARNDFRGYNQAIANGTLSPQVAAAEITAAMIPVLWIGAFLITVIMVPLLAANAIPKDQQIGVRELIDSLPLSPATYLAGKLFGLWLGIAAGVGWATLVAGIVWRLMVGPFDPALFIEIWLVGTLLLAFINGGTSLLLAAGQPTHRRAVLMGGAYVLLCLAGLGYIFSTDTGWWRWLNPARPAMVIYYTLGFPGAAAGMDSWTRAGIEILQQTAGRSDVFISIGFGLLQVGLLWLIVWQWVKKRKV